MKNNISVFLAEDDESQARLYRIAASEVFPGLNLEVFGDAEQLLKSLSDKSRPLPRLIIMDSRLESVSGIEAAKRIKRDSRLSCIPVIIFSASEHRDFLGECYDSGANACLVKPAEYEDLRQLLADTFGFWLHTNRLPE